MNGKDLEGFNKWRNSQLRRPEIYDAWQSACEYMQAELAHHIFMIQAENKKLREALDKCKRLILLADKSVCKFEMNDISLIQWNEFIKDFPEEALKEIGDL